MKWWNVWLIFGTWQVQMTLLLAIGVKSAMLHVGGKNKQLYSCRTIYFKFISNACAIYLEATCTRWNHATSCMSLDNIVFSDAWSTLLDHDRANILDEIYYGSFGLVTIIGCCTILKYSYNTCKKNYFLLDGFVKCMCFMQTLMLMVFQTCICQHDAYSLLGIIAISKF